MVVDPKIDAIGSYFKRHISSAIEASEVLGCHRVSLCHAVVETLILEVLRLHELGDVGA